MKYSILDLMHKELIHLKYDKSLMKKVEAFRHDWATENEQHSLFLAGNSLGVQVIKFTSLHYSNFFIDVVEHDAIEMQTKLFSLDSLDAKFRVSSDALNITLVYLIRQFSISKYLSKRDKITVIKELYYIFAYRVTTSWTTNSFTYNVDPQVALAVHEQLSNKFLIKKLGTWNKVYDHRSKDLLPKGIFYDRINEFSDEIIPQTINSINGRLRAILKKLTNEIVKITASKEKVLTEAATILDMEGESTLRDITSKLGKHIDEVVDQVHDSGSFINDDLVRLATKMVPNSNTDLLQQLLVYITLISGGSGYKKVEELTRDTLLITSEMLNSRDTDVFDISNINDSIVAVKNYWSSSNSFTKHQKDMLKTKKHIRDIILKSRITRTRWIESSLRLSLIVYLYLKLVVMSK